MSSFHATCGHQGSPHSQLSEALMRKVYEDSTYQAQDMGDWSGAQADRKTSTHLGKESTNAKAETTLKLASPDNVHQLCEV